MSRVPAYSMENELESKIQPTTIVENDLSYFSAEKAGCELSTEQPESVIRTNNNSSQDFEPENSEVHVAENNSLQVVDVDNGVKDGADGKEVQRAIGGLRNGNWIPDNFVEHFDAVTTSEQSSRIDGSSRQGGRNDTSEDEKFKKNSNESEDTATAPKAIDAPESRQLTVSVSPIIIEAESVAEGSASSMEIDVTPTEENDIISFKMTKSEFESFCGRKLRVRLHRLEDLLPLAQMNEE